jgi:hypothetical protein
MINLDFSIVWYYIDILIVHTHTHTKHEHTNKYIDRVGMHLKHVLYTLYNDKKTLLYTFKSIKNNRILNKIFHKNLSYDLIS